MTLNENTTLKYFLAASKETDKVKGYFANVLWLSEKVKMTQYVALKYWIKKNAETKFSKTLPLWNLYFHSPAVNTTSIVIQG